jgi:hypothetical protein
MRGCSVKLAVFDGGHQIGIRAVPSEAGTERGEKSFAFAISIETAEMLIEGLRDALKEAARRRA